MEYTSAIEILDPRSYIDPLLRWLVRRIIEGERLVGSGSVECLQVLNRIVSHARVKIEFRRPQKQRLVQHRNNSTRQ